MSQARFQQAMINYTNGQNVEANAELHAAQVLLVEAQNDLRQFMIAIMAASTTGQR
jgi:hypothetical protein